MKAGSLMMPETRSWEGAPIILVGGAPFHALSQEDCVSRVLASLEEGRGGWVLTANLDLLRQWHQDGGFRKCWRQASLVVPDGMPIIWASRLARRPLPERVAGSDMVTRLAAAAAVAGRSIYLLGGSPGVAEKAAARLQELFPHLRIAGWNCPSPGFEADPGAVAGIRSDLLRARPDLVYVALGSPKTEHLIARLKDALPATWWMGVGISLGFLAGEVRRAPRWMQAGGLEWLHRFSQEPRRLWARYFLKGLPFFFRLMAASCREAFLADPAPSRSRVEPRG